MPAASYTGSPGGAGNPPGKHSKGYTRVPGGQSGHFVMSKKYRGSMHVGGIKETPPVVGNQPKQRSTANLGLRTTAIPKVDSYKKGSY